MNDTPLAGGRPGAARLGYVGLRSGYTQWHLLALPSSLRRATAAGRGLGLATIIVARHSQWQAAAGALIRTSSGCKFGPAHAASLKLLTWRLREPGPRARGVPVRARGPRAGPSFATADWPRKRQRRIERATAGVAGGDLQSAVRVWVH
jgi:hypothetical protein